MPLCYIYFFFFFQAEDGIRDRNVTGVQTCALPISVAAIGAAITVVATHRHGTDEVKPVPHASTPGAEARNLEARSEERRVGKEWRSRRAADADKKKKKTKMSRV